MISRHRPLIHQRDTEVADVAALLPTAHVPQRRHFAHERELDWLVLALAQNGQSDLAAAGTDQLIEHELVGREPLHGDTIDLSDEVVGFETRPGRGAAVDRCDDPKVPLLCDEFDTEPNEMPERGA
jgi:hypothetical protein